MSEIKLGMQEQEVLTEDYGIVIPIKEYRELLLHKAKINVIRDLLSADDYVNISTLKAILKIK